MVVLLERFNFQRMEFSFSLFLSSLSCRERRIWFSIFLMSA